MINSGATINALFTSDLNAIGSFLGIANHNALLSSDFSASSIFTAIQTVLPSPSHTTAQNAGSGGGTIILIVIALLLIIRERNKTTSYKK
jgi:hypothetical protein